MAKIKGWSKFGEDAWETDAKTPDGLSNSVVELDEYDGYYRVTILDVRLNRRKHSQKFATKTRARNYARNYMKRHPRG